MPSTMNRMRSVTLSELLLTMSRSSKQISSPRPLLGDWRGLAVLPLAGSGGGSGRTPDVFVSCLIADFGAASSLGGLVLRTGSDVCTGAGAGASAAAWGAAVTG